MIPTIERSDDEEHCIVCGCRAIVAAWDRDRWRLSLVEDGKRLLFEPPRSEVDDELDLPGPVFQQCFPRIVDNRRGELLLVGQCGRRHFSAVFSLAAQDVSFEVADRWSTPLAIRRLQTTWTAALPGLSFEEIHSGIRIVAQGIVVSAQLAVETNPLAPSTKVYGWRLKST